MGGDPRQEAVLESGVPGTALCDHHPRRALWVGACRCGGVEERLWVGPRRPCARKPPRGTGRRSQQRLRCFHVILAHLSEWGVLSGRGAAGGTRGSEALHPRAAAGTWEKWVPVQSASSVSFHFRITASGPWFLCACEFQPMVAVPTLALVSNRFV